MGPCHTGGLPTNAEGNILPSLILMPTGLWHVGDKPRTVRAIRVDGGQQELGLGLLPWQWYCCRAKRAAAEDESPPGL